MPAALAETPTVGLGQLIKESRFDVPVHQRDYAWTEAEINKFFDDVESAMERQEDLYFLGLMVFQVGERGILDLLRKLLDFDAVALALGGALISRAGTRLRG